MSFFRTQPEKVQFDVRIVSGNISGPTAESHLTLFISVMISGAPKFMSGMVSWEFSPMILARSNALVLLKTEQYCLCNITHMDFASSRKCSSHQSGKQQWKRRLFFFLQMKRTINFSCFLFVNDDHHAFLKVVFFRFQWRNGTRMVALLNAELILFYFFLNPFILLTIAFLFLGSLLLDFYTDVNG